MFFSPSEGLYYCPIQSSNWNSGEDTLLFIFPPWNNVVLFCFFSLICTKTKIPYQCALPWIAIICGIVAHAPLFERGFFPGQAFGDTFCKCDFSVSHRQFQHLELTRKLAVPQIGVVFIVLCGQWQCYSEICRCLEYQYFGCCCILQFIWSLPLFSPRYMKICNTCLYHVEKLSNY